MVYWHYMRTGPVYRLEIAPCIILPLSRSALFSYVSDEPIQKGSLVSIPFGRRIIEGVVYDCRSLPGKTPMWMKSVSGIIEESFLTEEQLALAQEISEEYFTPLGKVLRHFLPKRAKKRSKADVSSSKCKTLRPKKMERDILKKFFSESVKKVFFLDTSGHGNDERLFSLLAQETNARKQQTLLLVPEIALIPAYEASLEKYFPKTSVAILHSMLSTGAYFDAWQRIRRGEAHVILATRQGLFAPFRDLGTIILSEEQDESYKQWDMSPRYYGKRVALMLGAFHKARVLFASNTPSAESIRGIEEKSILPLRPMRNVSLRGLSIVNLRLERFHKNYSPLSETLVAAIRETLTEGKQILLSVNRQGMSLFSVCEHCKEVLRCPNSGHPLVGSKEGHYRCLSCSYKTGIFPACPHCGHLSFKNIGFGTEKIEKEVARIFPAARIFRADGSAIQTYKAIRTLYEKGIAGTIDILIGTQMILKNPPLPKLSLVAMIDADSLLLFPDFMADERLFQRLSRSVWHTGSASKVIVQTFRPENAFFQKISEQEGTAFLHHILSERELLGYPPFGRLIAITAQGKTQKTAEGIANNIFRSLENILPKGSLHIAPPQTKKFPGRRGTYESSILLRLQKTNDIPDSLRIALRKISKDCIIDVDPL